MKPGVARRTASMSELFRLRTAWQVQAWVRLRVCKHVKERNVTKNSKDSRKGQRGNPKPEADPE